MSIAKVTQHEQADAVQRLQEHADVVRRMRSRLLEQLSERELIALEHCIASCEGGAAILSEAVKVFAL